ncbi:unnamed protein product [Alopecurus aequalis]
MAQFFRDRAPATSAWPPEYSSFAGPPTPSWPWRPPPSPTPEDDQSSSEGGAVTGFVIGFVALLLLFAVVYSLCKGRRESRALARAHERAAAWAAVPAARLRPQAEPRAREEDGRRQLRRASAPSSTARLPAFTYNQALKHDVTGSGEEAATCSVCLGVFQHGESVRLLPVCLHLFHVECINPWLDAHSTCPICRSDTGL